MERRPDLADLRARQLVTSHRQRLAHAGLPPAMMKVATSPGAGSTSARAPRGPRSLRSLSAPMLVADMSDDVSPISAYDGDMPEEQLNYLALDVVQHLPAEGVTQLLSSLRWQDSLVQELKQRNESLMEENQRLKEQEGFEEVHSSRGTVETISLTPSLKTRGVRREDSAEQLTPSALGSEDDRWIRKAVAAEKALRQCLQEALQGASAGPSKSARSTSAAERAAGPSEAEQLRRGCDELSEANSRLEHELSKARAELKRQGAELDRELEDLAKWRHQEELYTRLTSAKALKCRTRRQSSARWPEGLCGTTTSVATVQTVAAA